MNTQSLYKSFLLTTQAYDNNGHFQIILFGTALQGNAGNKPVKIIIDNYRPLFFIPHQTPEAGCVKTAAQRSSNLSLHSLDNTAVDCLYFRTYADYLSCIQTLKHHAVKTYESDIHPLQRYCMERMIKGGFSIEGEAYQKESFILFHNPRIRGTDVEVLLKVLSLDIETNAKTDQLYSIAAHGDESVVFMRGSGENTDSLVFCSSEKELLLQFFRHVHTYDPDIIIGWNIINFDLYILEKRCQHYGIAFELGRDKGTILKPLKNKSNQYYVYVPGRVVIDVPVILRAHRFNFQRYSLDHVAAAMLGKHKIIEKTGEEKIAAINRLFVEDKKMLAAYNLQDAILTKEIFDHSSVLPQAIEHSKRSGHLLDQYGGSIAAFDYLYLPLLHRAGYVAGNVADVPKPLEPLTGGYVMESSPGIYENVLLLDFKSLYPTIIMTFSIDPLAASVADNDPVKGPYGPPFSRKNSILPHIISELMEARKVAKDTNNKSLSYAIKILMNSFYGVLGSTGCRFFSPPLAQTITRTGQYIIKATQSYIEKKFGHTIIYGDTDSLFVLLGPGYENDAETVGTSIVQDVNVWLKSYCKEKFNVHSLLELELEAHFRYFFMPTIRGSSQGSKKRYCGALENAGTIDLVFKGLESARSDWTELAKEFQRNLYERIFVKKPFQEYIIHIVDQIRSGKADKKLIYRKQLRKPLHEYTASIPPHVQAARLLDKPPRIVHYYMTTAGPQPVEKRNAPLDYEHYIESQIKPVADAILEWCHTSFDRIVSGQQDLFAAV